MGRSTEEGVLWGGVLQEGLRGRGGGWVLWEGVLNNDKDWGKPNGQVINTLSTPNTNASTTTKLLICLGLFFVNLYSLVYCGPRTDETRLTLL